MRHGSDAHGADKRAGKHCTHWIGGKPWTGEAQRHGDIYDPATGQVIDYVGGQADLARRVLRAIGNPAERFAEDHLRLLRAVRFAAVLDFAIEPLTWQAVFRHAPHDFVRLLRSGRNLPAI